MMKIRLAGIEYESLVNGPGIRRVFFTQGCIHNCPGCQNPTTHDKNGGEYREIKDLVADLKDDPIVSGITLSGGDPFEQPIACTEFLKELKSVRPDINVWCYTGYTWEELKDKKSHWVDEMISLIDILVDGKFEKDKMADWVKFRGSYNQRIIDVKSSLDHDTIVELNLDNPQEGCIR